MTGATGGRSKLSKYKSEELKIIYLLKNKLYILK